MSDLPTTQKKLLALKALLGDEAAKKVLDEAEGREKSAQEAGIDFKEADKTSTTKDEKADEPIPLSELLAELEQGLEAGTIVDDTAEEDDENPEEAKEAEAELLALKELIAQVVDERIQTLSEKIKTKEAPAEAALSQLKSKLKEAETNVAALQKQINELNGVQPKNAAYRASQAEETVRQKGAAPVEQPGSDPFLSFVDTFVLGAGQNQSQP